MKMITKAQLLLRIPIYASLCIQAESNNIPNLLIPNLHHNTDIISEFSLALLFDWSLEDLLTYWETIRVGGTGYAKIYDGWPTMEGLCKRDGNRAIVQWRLSSMSDQPSLLCQSHRQSRVHIDVSWILFISHSISFNRRFFDHATHWFVLKSFLLSWQMMVSIDVVCSCSCSYWIFSDPHLLCQDAIRTGVFHNKGHELAPPVYRESEWPSCWHWHGPIVFNALSRFHNGTLG